MAQEPPTKEPEEAEQPGKLFEGKTKVETWQPPVRRWDTDRKELRHDTVEDARKVEEKTHSKTSLQAETGALWEVSEKEAAFRSTKKNEDEKTYASFLQVKGKAEFGKAGYDLKEMKAEAVAVDAHIEGSVVHGQVDFMEVGRSLLGIKDPRPATGTVFAPMAARLGDPTAHGTPLVPGTGSPNVFIEGRPAWRTLLDYKACPISHPPHVGGVVMVGAPTVFINFQQAVRVGDFVVEAGGGPNYIVGGAATVRIGEAAPAVAGQRKEYHTVDLSAQGDFLKAEADVQLKGELDLKKMNAEVVAKAGAKASVLSGSIDGKLHIPIPFTGYNVALGGSAEGSVLTAGAEGEVSGMINRVDPKTRKKVLIQGKASGSVGLALLGGGLGFSLGVEED